MRKAPAVIIGLSAAAVALLFTRKVVAAPAYPPAQFEYLPELLVNRRGTGLESIHNFIRPGEVADLYGSLGSTLASYDWVVRNILYVADPGEHWQYPVETVIRGAGDCEDSGFLMTSLIRNEETAYAVLGWFVSGGQVWGHVWVTCRGSIFEPTLSEMPENPWQKENELSATYIPMLYLTESEIYAISGYPELLTPSFISGFSEEITQSSFEDKQKALEEFWRRR